MDYKVFLSSTLSESAWNIKSSLLPIPIRVCVEYKFFIVAYFYLSPLIGDDRANGPQLSPSSSPGWTSLLPQSREGQEGR